MSESLLTENTAAVPESGEKFFNEQQVQELIRKRLERDRRVRGDAEAENEKLINRLAELETELAAARGQLTESDSLREQLTQTRAAQEAAERALVDQQAAALIDRSLDQAGIKPAVRGVAADLIRARGEIARDTDGKLTIHYGGQALEQALWDRELFPDDFREAPRGGGSGSGGSGKDAQAHVMRFAQAREAIRSGDYRRMNAAQRAEVNRVLAENRSPQT